MVGISSRVGESHKSIVEGPASDQSWKQRFGKSIKIPQGIHTNIDPANANNIMKSGKSSPYNSKIVIPEI